MNIDLTEQDIKTLNYNQGDLWNYTVKTKKGKLIGSNIATKEDAIKHAEIECARILESILSKN